MATVDVKCPFCQQTDPVKKHRLGSTGHQRFRWTIIEMQLICEVDEMWSFVGNKK